MRSSRPTSGRLGGDQGAALIEFALVAPVLALFMLGTLEFGLVWRNRTSVANALRLTARTDASLSGNRDRLAEYYALDQFRTATANLDRMTLQKLVVFKTNNNGAFLDSTCNTKSPENDANGNGTANFCNIYGPAQLSVLTSNIAKFGSTSASTTCNTTNQWDGWWCPINRENNIAATSGPDFLGVRSVYTYTLITRVLPNSTITMTDTAVIRIEPKVGS